MQKVLWHIHLFEMPVHSKLTGLRRMSVGIGPLVCINNLLITPVDNVVIRLGCQGKGTDDLSRQ